MNNIVAIVGRPNVGKSTFYNRLIGGRDAIVDNISGVTRDRKYGTAEWNGKQFVVIDTGGFVQGSDDVFESAIRSQVELAIEEAAIILFMVDAQTGMTDLDDEVAEMLRRTKKPVVLAVNKVDNHRYLLEAQEFWAMGIEHTFFFSSATGSGTGEILDYIAENIENYEPLDTELHKLAIVGQPNVGKSSLLNALVGEERSIVTDIAGTTRDPIHTHYKKFDKEFMIVDTAGMRKKAKVHEDLEFYSVMRAIKAIEDCDVAMLMIDAMEGVEQQDMAIFKLAVERHKGVVIVVNKWDLVEKETNTARDYEEGIKKRLAPFKDVPVVFVSATEKLRIMKAVEVALEVAENRHQKIKTSALNDWIGDVQDKFTPPAYRGHLIKIKYATQLPLYYPAFAFFCNHPKFVPDNYRGYLENEMRKTFNFNGVPISIFFREK